MSSKVVKFPKRDTRRENPVGFYIPADAARLARIPRQRLDAWRRMGLIPRDLVFVGFSGDEDEGYSFESLVYLRVVRMLRQYESLQRAVDTVRHLIDRFGSPGPDWADARLLVEGSHVLVIARDEWQVTNVQHKTRLMHQIVFEEDFEQLRARADALLIPREFQEYIEIDPSVASGYPTVRGTAVRSSVLYALHSRDYSQKKIAQEYPFLNRAQIRKAVDFEHFLDYSAKVA